jgi:hypothetical protein
MLLNPFDDSQEIFSLIKREGQGSKEIDQIEVIEVRLPQGSKAPHLTELMEVLKRLINLFDHP